MIIWYLNFKYFIKNIFIGIKNLWIWFPVIWRYRNFDNGYLIDLNIKKLEMMHKWFSNSKNNHILDSHRKYIEQRIATAVKLMKLVQDKYYSSEYILQIEKLYGKNRFVFKPYGNHKDSYKMVMEFDKKYTDEELEKIYKHEKELFLKSYEKHKKAKRILWKFIEHNIDWWWD